MFLFSSLSRSLSSLGIDYEAKSMTFFCSFVLCYVVCTFHGWKDQGAEISSSCGRASVNCVARKGRCEAPRDVC